MFKEGRLRLLLAITMAVMLGVVAILPLTPAMASSNRDNLKLFEKDALGRINHKGASGKLDFTLSGPSFKFDFGGEALPPNANYSLIRSREPGITLPYRFDVIGQGTSDSYGHLALSGSCPFNMTLISAQILLVPTEAIGPQQPDGAFSLRSLTSFPKCLFGQEFISYTYTGTTMQLQGGTDWRPQVSSPPAPLTAWDVLGPKAGDEAIDFTLMGIDPSQPLANGNNEQLLTKYQLSELCAAKPVVLVFGAYT